MYHNRNSNRRIKTGKNLFVWGIVLVVMAAIAVADIEQVPVELVAKEDVGAMAVDVSSGRADVSTGEWIKVFKCGEEEDFGVRKALALLGSLCRKNIVPTPNVDGPVTFRSLSNITFEEAMDAILGESFVYEQKGNLIKVYTREEYKKLREDPDRMMYKVFTLYYISAAEARKLISPVLSASGKIEATTAAETGVPTSETISTQAGGGDTTALNDTIVVYDFPENIARVEEVIKSVDIRPKQVLIEATILSATLTEDMQFGIDWQTLKGTAVSSLAGIASGASDYLKSDGTSAKVESALTGGLTIGFALGDVGAFIRAVEEVTDITILANPKILAINKQLGQVYIGRKVGYRDNPMTLDTGVVSEGEVKFLDTGTKLSFRPYIGNDGYIRMDIHPKDSSGSLTSGIPNEDSAELVTNIMVKDGQTVVIGGLFRDKTTNVKSQIPLLGDLPVVGGVFRGTADKVERQEVIILLTPHIIEEPSETEGDARADDIRRKRFGAKDELEWVSRSRLAEDRYAKAAKYYLDDDNEAAMRELNIVLTLRPAYLEAIRLKERIIVETDPDAAAMIERKVIDSVEQEDLDKWLRR
jgi:type II secretory pathway component GspD/PulD (secretin)